MAPTRKLFSTKVIAEVLKYITERGCSNSAASRNFGIDERAVEGGKVSQTLSIKLSKMGFPKPNNYLVLAGDYFRGLRGDCLSVDSIETVTETALTSSVCGIFSNILTAWCYYSYRISSFLFPKTPRK